MWVRGGGDYLGCVEALFLFVALAAALGRAPAPGAAACRGYGGKAVVGGGRTGRSGHPYINEEVDAGGHGGRRVGLVTT